MQAQRRQNLEERGCRLGQSHSIDYTRVGSVAKVALPKRWATGYGFPSSRSDLSVLSLSHTPTIHIAHTASEGCEAFFRKLLALRASFICFAPFADHRPERFHNLDAMDDNGRWSSSLSDVAGNTLPEHHSALALLQQLDHAWFLDNLLKPRIGLINAFCPSSDPPLSPYQSIELVDATNGKWGFSARHDRPHRGDMPCIRFEVPSHSEAPARAVDLSESSSNLQLNDQQASVPPGGTEQPLTPRRHVSASCPLAHVVLCPPTRALTLPTEDFYHVKEIQVDQVSRAPDFETIASGKPLRVSLVDTHLPQPVFRVRKARRRSSRSMTAIEFDEVQGFTDLGFQFSQDDLTPRIVTMFPALKHKLGEDGELGVRQVIHSKPKQSSLEAWLIRGSTVPFHHGQIPSTSEDMKEHLKFWARAVASTVRQEC